MSGLRRQLSRPLIACLVLLTAYVGLSFLNDPHGYLGTDTGGKVATLRAMERNHGLNPDVGYWAARWDPTGRLHPLYYTSRIGTKWVNVTTLPALYAAYPLFRLGGYRLALLIPMLGSVLAALAARALALRLGARSTTAEAAFWLAGLASPLTIYALDFWEHSVGVALMAWAVVLLVDVLRRPALPRVLWPALGAGLLFGLSSTMRTESLVYGGVATGIVCLVLARRGWPGRLREAVTRAVAVGLAGLAGLAVPFLLNSALEQATIGGTLRAERASGTLAGVGSVASGRVGEAALTAVGLQPDARVGTYLTGLVMVLLVLVACTMAGMPARRRLAVVAAAGVGILYLARFATGLGFVPGMLATTPIAIVGLLAVRRSASAGLIAAAAILSLPVVWTFQYLGGAAPQWGGRYILVSGFLLALLGVVELASRPTAVRAGVAGIAVAVTLFGVAWLSQRSHGVADAERALGRRPEPILVSTVAHLAREGGAHFGVIGDKPWLTAITTDDLRLATHVVLESGQRRLGLITLENHQADLALPGFAAVGRGDIRFLPGVYLRVTTYQA